MDDAAVRPGREAAVSVLRVSLLGRFSAVSPAGPVAGLDGRRVQELFGYLLLSERRANQREVLADRLWPDGDSLRGRKQLRQVLWQLQKVLDRRGTDPPVLLVDDGWVELNAGAAIWVDVAEIESVYRSTGAVPPDQLGTREAADLGRAVGLYQGELLQGCYQDWCVFERERCRAMYLALLDRLTAHSEGTGRWEDGLTYCRRLLREDRASERTYRRMMRLSYLAGDRTGALRHFEACARVLAAELDVGPSATTVALFEQIRDDRGVGYEVPGPPAADVLSLTCASLVELQGALSRANNLVSLQISALERLRATGGA